MLKNREELFKKFIKWLKYFKNQVGTKGKSTTARESVLRAIRTDNGGEYLSKRSFEKLESRGTEHWTTVPYNPQQNELAEWFNQTLMNMVRSMSRHKQVPKSFWAEAPNVAMYVRNQVTCKSFPKYLTLFELWHD